jgi:hypothetical protein
MMLLRRLALPFCLCCCSLAHAALAQGKTSSPRPPAGTPDKPAAADVENDDDEAHGAHFLYGLAGGALNYKEGRDEQAFGGVLRWLPAPWLSLSATPTVVRVQSPALSATAPATSKSGLVDLPLEATVSHGFPLPFHPSFAASLGVTLPVGDTATGFGAGEVGYSASGGVGFSPIDRMWVHIGAGRSLTRFSVGSAFSSGTGWGDVGAGVSLTDRLSLSSGYSSDVGAVDSTLGRSTSLNGGGSFVVHGPTTLNLNASHGLGGSAPRWSMALGIGTAFPYLNHLGGASSVSTLQQTFGGGTHGLPKSPGNSGQGSGSGGTTTSGRGHGKKGP